MQYHESKNEKSHHKHLCADLTSKDIDKVIYDEVAIIKFFNEKEMYLQYIESFQK